MPRAIRILFLGDVVGAPGRAAVQKHLPELRASLKPDAVIVNGENIRNGSGITADLYRALREAGADAVTLGDHVYKDARISQTIEDPGEPILRPANLSAKAPGKRWIRIPAHGERIRDIFVATVLGRVVFPMPADDPFATCDEILRSLPERKPIVIVEAHMEATSEKAALAHHLDGRVAAVLGSHTHVPTADERILPGGTAFLSDLGMCGPCDGVIGRDASRVVHHMTTAMPVQYEVSGGEIRVCGALVEVSTDTGLALSIERVEAGESRRTRVRA
jgi:metallophosphoesterase (TIGR00282 family)